MVCRYLCTEPYRVHHMAQKEQHQKEINQVSKSKKAGRIESLK